jgi:ribosomal protein S18 acetylase RimI-like enzyme
MKKGLFRIVPMSSSHIEQCELITAGSDPWITLHERIDFKKYILLKEAHVCIAGNKVAGFLVFTPEPVFARGGYLRALGVSPSMRRQGIGLLLLTFAEKETARFSRNLYLCVSSFNRNAQTFYKKLGYARAGKLTDLIIPGASEYIYWKRLRPLSREARSAKRD